LLTAGSRLGPFDIVSTLGAGGMGEVFRARDSRLNRDVAIKILPETLAADPERVARFAREAQSLAALNHPHIAQIYGVEEQGTTRALVMELVDGDTLADRIARGAVPVDEATAIARQIAEALEAAHEAGIIHRDLKPANIKVRPDATVKVLDFGLAKALDPVGASRAGGTGQEVINSPTITSPAMTQAGLILGTAAYMSPEQAKGRPVDERTDVWAFGCVLYEMLTGRRAFDGEDVTDTIAAVVRGDPDWRALPNDTPAQLTLLLKRCLEKDRRTRITNIGVVRFLLNERLVAEPSLAPLPLPRPPAGPARWKVATAAALGVAGGAALVLAGVWARSQPAVVQAPVRFTFAPSSTQALLVQGNDHDIAIAPDGSYVVYRAGPSALQGQLMIRSLNELEARVLPGTASARFPFISPDGRWVGFQVANELRKVAITGGPAQIIARVGGAPRGASWGDDGFIVFSTADTRSLQRVDAEGGEPKPITTVDASSREAHSLPHVLPQSRYALFTVQSLNEIQTTRVEAVNLQTGERKTLVRGGADAAYVSTGHLVYATVDVPAGENRFRGVLRAVRFDASRAEPIGDSVAVVDAVTVLPSAAANYAVSRKGDLVFLPAGVTSGAAPRRTLLWVNRKGQESAIAAPSRSYAVARLSPDGSKIALDVRDQAADIWIWDLSRQTLTPLNRDPAADMSPLWTPDGRRVIWTSTRGGGNPNLFWQAADGTGVAERLTTNAMNQFPTSLSPDGRDALVFGAGAAGAMDIFRVPLQQSDRVAQPLISSSAVEVGAEVSPDGRWVAYQSNESGESQVYVRPYPNVQEARAQISTTGGTRPAWAKNGRELFYVDRDGFLTSVAVNSASGAAFVAGTPQRVLNAKYYSGSSILGLDLRAYDVAADGQRFLMIKETEPTDRSAESPPMVVVLNWSGELRSRLP
jgi:Tol biopolymer transport system component